MDSLGTRHTRASIRLPSQVAGSKGLHLTLLSPPFGATPVLDAILSSKAISTAPES